jgi:hypothetical protein
MSQLLGRLQLQELSELERPVMPGKEISAN